jgi:MoxR-like ATPase
MNAGYLGPRLNHAQLEELIKRAYEEKLALFIWGAPGIGKSMTVEKVARELAKIMGREYLKWNEISRKKRLEVAENPTKYFVLVDIRLSQYDPSDLKGIPRLDGLHTDWRPPLWLYTLSLEGAAGIIFLDELNLAPPSVQSAAYQLVLDKCLGDYRLSPMVGVIAAGNPPDYRPHSHDPAPPLLNRFLNVELAIPDVDSWAQWALENGVDPRIVSFLKMRPELLFKWTPELRSAAFPTPRTWSFASTMLKKATDADGIGISVAAAVGVGVANEFLAFLKLTQGFDVQAILASPETAPLPKSPDEVYALLAALQSHYVKHRSPELLERMFILAQRISTELSAEYAIFLLKSLKAIDQDLFMRVGETSPTFGDLSKKIVPMAYGS